ncbi:MAG: response regulator [Planctomycetes bacterium]|nr:response regulator [Planctomycetota bacterium]
MNDKSDEAFVLIVEPSRLLCQAAEQACVRRGIRSCMVPEVGKALTVIGRRKPTAILTALELPGLSGASLIAALKCCMFHRAIPIALMTSTDTWSDRLCAHRADAIIKKEVNLRSSIMDFLASFHIGRDLASPAAEPDLKPFHANILLAEDCSMVHRLLSRFLHVAGAEVVVVENGVDAVRVAGQQPFDLILMDIEMPEMDGFAATRRLREQGIRLPILAVTAYEGDDFRRQATEAGFDDILQKPTEARVIIAKCAEHLRRTREGHLTPSWSIS